MLFRSSVLFLLADVSMPMSFALLFSWLNFLSIANKLTQSLSHMHCNSGFIQSLPGGAVCVNTNVCIIYYFLKTHFIVFSREKHKQHNKSHSQEIGKLCLFKKNS